MDCKKARKLMILSFLVVVISYFAPAILDMTNLCTPREFSVPVRNSEGKFDLTEVSINDCYNIAAGFFDPLIKIAFVVLVISLALYFSQETTFNSWFRFAKYYLPVAVVLIFLTPTQSSSFLNIDKELVTWWLAGIFLVVSMILIAYKQLWGKS